MLYLNDILTMPVHSGSRQAAQVCDLFCGEAAFDHIAYLDL